MGHKGKGLHMVTFLLLIVGGLNWLILALFNWEIGNLFGGMDAIISKIIYILFGLSAVYELFTHRNSCQHCEAKSGGAPAAPSSPDGGQPQG